MDEKQFNELVEKVGKEAADKIKSLFDQHAAKAITTDNLKDSITEALKGITLEASSIKIGEKSIEEILRIQGDDITKAMEAAEKNQSIVSIGSISNSIAKSIKDNADQWKDMINKKSPFVVELKAADTMTTSSVPTSASTLVPSQTLLPGVISYRTNDPIVLQYANVFRTSSRNIDWIDETAGEGDADWTAEGAAKPLQDVNITVRRVTATKVAVVAKATEESLADIPFLQSLIETRLRRSLALKIDDGLLNGDGTSEQPYGISYYAPAFTNTEMNGTVKSPNYYDALGAAATQIQRANFMPTIVFINPVDWFVMMHKKDTTEQYVLLSLQMANGNFLQMTAVKSNQVPAGTFIMADMSYFRVAIREDVRLEIGWENDDFRKNLRTIILEGRLSAFVSENEKLAFCMDTYDNIMDAIAETQI